MYSNETGRLINYPGWAIFADGEMVWVDSIKNGRVRFTCRGIVPPNCGVCLLKNIVMLDELSDLEKLVYIKDLK